MRKATGFQRGGKSHRPLSQEQVAKIVLQGLDEVNKNDNGITQE
jgi:hypothetical protein